MIACDLHLCLGAQCDPSYACIVCIPDKMFYFYKYVVKICAWVYILISRKYLKVNVSLFVQ